MHKILVTADSHGSAYALYLIARAEPDAEAMMYLGDGLRDLEAMTSQYPRLRVYSVRGNCDRGAPEAEEGLAPFGGVLFFYTHGDQYGVRNSLNRLARTARERGADVALYGHTHIAACEEIDGVTLFNPGSVGRPRQGEPCYGVITIEEGRVHFEHRRVPALWEMLSHKA